MRFGVLDNPDAPYEELVERWQRVEDLGFDQLFTADHAADYRGPSAIWFDGWTTLAAMAHATTHIRVGTLVTNPVLRPPALLAREAAALDNLSGGRLELGIGSGIAPFDHEASGIPYWEPKERASRFAEYVHLVDALLRSGGHGHGVAFDGDYFATRHTPLPAPVQHPRPPIVVGGQSPTALRLAAEVGDAWNTHGPFGRSVDEIVAVTTEQGQRLDALCEEQGRDPGEVRRCVLHFAALAPGSAAAFEEMVERFAAAGASEFVLMWPADDTEAAVFEEIATETIPRLRAAAA